MQSSAREEIVRMNAGMSVLDVIITISPLLGLLGTASGLVTAFSDLEDNERIRAGIATALSTTIVGIAITVPAVVAQGVVITVDGEGGVVKLSPSQRHGVKIMMVASGGYIIIAHGLHVADANTALLT